jgi:hypothetical protein
MSSARAHNVHGSDGLFAWCIDQLRRRDVTGLLGV